MITAIEIGIRFVIFGIAALRVRGIVARWGTTELHFEIIQGNGVVNLPDQ